MSHRGSLLEGRDGRVRSGRLVHQPLLHGQNDLHVHLQINNKQVDTNLRYKLARDKLEILIGLQQLPTHLQSSAMPQGR